MTPQKYQSLQYLRIEYGFLLLSSHFDVPEDRSATADPDKYHG